MVDRERRRIEVPDLSRADYETRVVILALSIEAHDEDEYRKTELQEEDYARRGRLSVYERNYKPYWIPALDYLSQKLGSSFEVEADEDRIRQILTELQINVFSSVRKVGRYTSESQKVKFVIVTVVSKRDFKKALEIEEPQLHVIYNGHSRYGRGACFDTYTDVCYEEPRRQEGRQWGSGSSDDNGLFLLGYPYVPVALNDIEHHKYLFSPVPVEEGLPPNERSPPYSRHPHARRSLRSISLSTELQELVWASNKSPSNQYYGLTLQGEDNLLLHVGWMNTVNNPYDLGATDLKCKVFCHFGCSSRLHFWDIVRKDAYKGWVRPTPPTDKYAYFATAPSDARITPLWLYYLLSYDRRNNFQPWWDSLESAKRKTNIKLRSIRAGFEIY